MGLPYHQTSIRKQEMPPKHLVDKKWIFSEGKRKFLRYSYGDLLSNKRKFDILFRIWPGTQRILIWGDPDLARGYGEQFLNQFQDSFLVAIEVEKSCTTYPTEDNCSFD